MGVSLIEQTIIEFRVDLFRIILLGCDHTTVSVALAPPLKGPGLIAMGKTDQAFPREAQ